MEDRLDKVSDLRAKFKAFHKASVEIEKIYNRFSQEREMFNYQINHLKDPDPSEINPILDAWLTYRNKLAGEDKIDSDEES